MEAGQYFRFFVFPTNMCMLIGEKIRIMNFHMSIVRYKISGKTVLCTQVGGLNDTNLVSLLGFLQTVKLISAVIKTAYH